MGKFIVKKEDILPYLEGQEDIAFIKKNALDCFNSTVLGLGSINSKSLPVNAIAVIFDLEGFTKFCTQIDPQLAVPDFLNLFLEWLFFKIKEISICATVEDGYQIYFEPPFFSKFLGDGVLFLWETDSKTEVEMNNIVTSCERIKRHYKEEFIPAIRNKVSYVPIALRCGIARGTVYSVGNGDDYVGTCINLAARLQKLHSLTFAFSRKGFNYEFNMPKNRSDIFCVKEVQIRGIGDHELVCVLKNEYENLTEEEKKHFL